MRDYKQIVADAVGRSGPLAVPLALWTTICAALLSRGDFNAVHLYWPEMERILFWFFWVWSGGLVLAALVDLGVKPKRKPIIAGKPRI